MSAWVTKLHTSTRNTSAPTLALFTSWIAVRMASLSDRLFREKVRYTRPARTLIVASSHPASNNASWTSGVSSVMPDRTRAKSCSRSHSIPGFVFIVLFHVLLFLLALMCLLGCRDRLIHRILLPCVDTCQAKSSGDYTLRGHE